MKDDEEETKNPLGLQLSLHLGNYKESEILSDCLWPVVRYGFGVEKWICQGLIFG